MANPQPTDAHLRIAHSIQEHIMTSVFTERELRVLFLILRLSWGCGKHSAYIPKQVDFEVVGVGKGHIKEILDYLSESSVITRNGDYYEFNKDFERWNISHCRSFKQEKVTELVTLNLSTPDQELRKKVTNSVTEKLPKGEQPSYRKGNSPTPELASPKENVKENYIYDDGNYINTLTGVVVEVSELISKDAGDLWNKTLLSLKGQVSAANYRTWLDKTVGLYYHETYFIVGVENAHIEQYLDGNMRSLLESTLMQVTQREFKICFFDIENDIG